MPTIRPYQDSDRDALYVLAERNFAAFLSSGKTLDRDRLEAYFEHIIAIPKQHNGQLLVAIASDALLGYVCLLGPIAATESEEGGEPYAFMSDLYVDESFRGQGIGTSLAREAEARCADMGIGKLALRVAADNMPARGFYGHCDYTEKFVVMSKPIRRKPPA